MPARIEALAQDELTAEQQSDIESDFLGFFEIVLLAFAGIALIVATFSIHNTFSILVAQRTRESALLRAIGASRRQILTSVTGEALAIGVIASAVGFAAGLGLATGLLALMSGAGLDLPTAGLTVGTDTIVIAAAVGILTTLVASVTPALKASRVAPLAALRDVAVDRSASSFVRALVGAIVAAAGVATVVTASSSADGALGRAGLGALGVLVGAVILGPVVARPAAAVLGTGASATRGFTGRLARRNAMRNPRRIASSASALMVGTAVVALFTTFGASIEASIDDAVDTHLQRRPRRPPGGLQRVDDAGRAGPGDRRAAGGRRRRRRGVRRRGHRRRRRRAGDHRTGAVRRIVRPRCHRRLARRPGAGPAGDQRAVRRRAHASPSATR